MLALVTGASSGIGLEYAKALAEQGYDLLIVSNQEKEIKETAISLHREWNVDVTPLYVDLTDENAVKDLVNYCHEHKMDVDVLVNNAGVFFFNELVKTDPRRIDLMLDLHVKAVTRMCRYFGEDMKKRGSGRIINMSSMSAWMTMPGINIYNATKAYILNFSRSLWYELKPHGVTVTAVCPGAVDTTLYGLSTYWRKVAVGLGVSMPPAKLVRKALKASQKGKKQTMPGLINHLFVPIIKHLPDWFVFAVIKRLKQFQK
ncbi:MAG: SDR family NAD(P)-dependent oxidoreductase [Paludibacteraceae bacterium]|nr:SDR family NAD(P)-dependent oxidoreductase [Paludibacteraceae bacterium]